MGNSKRLLVVFLLVAAACAMAAFFTPTVSAINCSIVRCPGCPDGYVLKPTGSNCCRCVPIKP
jgi:hypothetical protein